MRISVVLMLVLLIACAEIYEELSKHEEDDKHKEHTEILTLGPYTDAVRWGFSSKIALWSTTKKRNAGTFSMTALKASTLKPGYIYTLEVRLEDRGTEIQDVGRYSYHLIKIVYKVKAPDDFNYAKNEKPELSDLESDAGE